MEKKMRKKKGRGGEVRGRYTRGYKERSRGWSQSVIANEKEIEQCSTRSH